MSNQALHEMVMLFFIGLYGSIMGMNIVSDWVMSPLCNIFKKRVCTFTLQAMLIDILSGNL